MVLVRNVGEVEGVWGGVRLGGGGNFHHFLSMMGTLFYILYIFQNPRNASAFFWPYIQAQGACCNSFQEVLFSYLFAFGCTLGYSLEVTHFAL